MRQDIDALKGKFRAGRKEEAIAECEALCARADAAPEVKRLCATMHAMTGNHKRALELLQAVRDPAREDPDVLFNIGMCQRELKDIAAAVETFDLYARRFPGHADGWACLAEARSQSGHFDAAIAAADRAIALDPGLTPVWRVRANCHEALGRWTEAAADFKVVLSMAPGDAAALKKATTCLLEIGRGEDALDLCRDIVRRQPENLTARLGAEWVLGQQVPLWHVPMMNEPQRNQAYQDGLAKVVDPDALVFEIGTGSGLVSMMAARLGAQQVVSCEAVGLVARTAQKIVQKNGFAQRVTVHAKPSYEVKLGEDLPRPADVLVHEIFSSELLGEHVLPAIEDAKRRLLKPGGAIMPRSASIMIALVGGDAVAGNAWVKGWDGLDLSEFNAIYPRKRPLFREDLDPLLLSDSVEAFCFDFVRQDAFPPERKRLPLTATAAGECQGLIQWIRLEMAEGVYYENHPSRPQPVSGWQHTVYAFDAPLQLTLGKQVIVEASHDRARPWFVRVG